jgi:integrase/recombinase XerC
MGRPAPKDSTASREEKQRPSRINQSDHRASLQSTTKEHNRSGPQTDEQRGRTVTELTGWASTNKSAALELHPLPYMQEYLDELTGRNLNAGYIRGVRAGMVHLADFLHKEGIKHPGEVERAHIMRYQGDCNQQDWAKSYRSQMLKKVRQWFNWLTDLGYIDKNPWHNIKLPVPAKRPKPLSDEDVELLFESHRKGAYRLAPFIFHRREIILCLLYAWGLRLHELASLDFDKLDPRLDFVIVKNKGGTVKHLPYSDEMKKIFNRWGRVRQQYAKSDEDALLITNQGTRLSDGDIYRIVTELGEEAHVKINPHRMRDTCATHLLDDDVAVERAAAILGHSNIKMTLAYARVNDKGVKASHEKSMDPRIMNLFNNTRDLTDD